MGLRLERWLATLKQLTQFPPVILDGGLYVLIALFNSLAAGLASDEAAKFVSPSVLFWMRLGFFSIAQMLLAAKMFRSTAFADHQKQVKESDTQRWEKYPPPPVAIAPQPESKT
jgi:hypothetical protein